MCVQTICRARPSLAAIWALEVLLLGYNDVQDGFEGLWNMCSGPADESRALQGFRERLHGARRRRQDALFDLTDAILTADPVPSI
jgi:hypothetical protein